MIAPRFPFSGSGQVLLMKGDYGSVSLRDNTYLNRGRTGPIHGVPGHSQMRIWRKHPDFTTGTIGELIMSAFGKL